MQIANFLQGPLMQDPASFTRRLGLFAFLPIGLLMLAGAAAIVWTTTAWLKRTVEVQGTVVEMRRTADKDMFQPVVRFLTANGKTIQFDTSFRSNPPAYRVGETVRVVYLPEEPERPAVRGFLSLWMGPMILGFIGAIFTAVGAGMIAAGRGAARAAAQAAAPA